MMQIRAFAKVNMVLEVLGILKNNDSLSRPYHNTSGIYQNIDLFDLIEIKESKFDVIKTTNLEIPESLFFCTISCLLICIAIIDFNQFINLSSKEHPDYFHAFHERGVAEFFKEDSVDACIDWNYAAENGYSKSIKLIQKNCNIHSASPE